jgi:hypothetical protein
MIVLRRLRERLSGEDVLARAEASLLSNVCGPVRLCYLMIAVRCDYLGRLMELVDDVK